MLQNADDIARENDRQRAIKCQQRKSWGAEVLRPDLRVKQERPLSTGHLVSQLTVGTVVNLANLLDVVSLQKFSSHAILLLYFFKKDRVFKV